MNPFREIDKIGIVTCIDCYVHVHLVSSKDLLLLLNQQVCQVTDDLTSLGWRQFNKIKQTAVRIVLLTRLGSGILYTVELCMRV